MAHAAYRECYLLLAADAQTAQQVCELLLGLNPAAEYEVALPGAPLPAHLQRHSYQACLIAHPLDAPETHALLQELQQSESTLPAILLADAVDMEEAWAAGLCDCLEWSELTPRSLKRSLQFAAHLAGERREVARLQASRRPLLEEVKQLNGIINEHALVSRADRNGRITYVNDRFCEVSGYARNELIGKPHSIIKSSLHGPEFYAGLWDTIASGKVWQGVICNRRKDGSHYWVRGTISPLLDADGQIDGYLSIRTDITAIKESELSLRLMAQAIESSASGIVIADARRDDMPCIYYNAAFARMTGSEPQPFLSEQGHIRPIRKPRQKGLEPIRDAIQTGQTTRLQIAGRRKDSSRWIDFSVAPVSDDSGRVTHHIGIATDVTALQEAELALRQSEERLRRAQAYANIGTWDWNMETGEIFWSERIGPMFGYDGVVETSYENFIKAVHPDDRQQLIEAVRACIHEGAKYEIEHRCVWPDGSVRWMLEQGDVTRAADGRPLHMLGVVQDITARKLAEEKLQNTKLRLANAQRIARLGNWDYDIATGEIDWSDEIYQIFGRSAAEFTPNYENFLSTIHPDDVAKFKASEQEALRTGVQDVKHRIVLPNGAIRHVHELGEVYFDAAHKPLHMSGTVQDITLRVEREQQLQEAKEAAERANQAKSMFLSSMSHELRTPMNAILGFAQLLRMRDDLNQEQQESIQEIERAGRHLLELINEVLDLAKIEAGLRQVVLQPVRCCDLVDESISLTRSMARSHGVTLAEDDRSLCPIWLRADRRQLKQVLVNLITNAIKYNRPQGKVMLRLSRVTPGYARVEVSDTGIGIAPEQHAELFEPFQRLGADEKGIEGTGIGLAISKRLIEAMGGRIGVESTPGVGSTFWLEVPECDGPAQSAARQTAKPIGRTARSTAKLLYIEDNRANMRVMEKLISHRPGWQLLQAPRPEIGLELAQEHLPDLILLDLKMPGMDGYEVLRRLRQHPATSGIPVIAVTANLMEFDKDQARAAGFRDYLAKPIETERVLATLDDVLR